MVKVSYKGKTIFIDGFLKDNLDICKHQIKNDRDMIFAVDGYEREGKSTLVQQCAWYCSNGNLKLKNITFNPIQFQDAIYNANKYDVIIYDEGYGGLNAKATMSKVNRTIIKTLTEIGDRNLFIFIVLPSFFDLDKYVALWRSIALIHIYSKSFERGRFAFYNRKQKKSLYVDGKKYYNYVTKPNFRGRFAKGYMVDKEEYKKKKRISTEQKIEDPEGNSKYKQQRNSLIFSLYNSGIKVTKILEDVNMFAKVKINTTGIYYIINQLKNIDGGSKNESNTNN